MSNPYAVKINNTLGVKVYDESNLNRLSVIKYTKKQIKQLVIGDLINPETKKGTERLSRLTKEIIFGSNNA